MRHFLFRIVGVFALLAIPSIAMAASGYTVVPVAPPSGEDFGTAYSVNNNNQVIGFSADFDISQLPGKVTATSEAGFVYTGSNLVVLPALGTTGKGESFSIPFAINDSGEIVGVSTVPGGTTGLFGGDGFTYSGGVLTHFSPTSGSFFVPFALNSSGTLSGEDKTGTAIDSTSQPFSYNGSVGLLGNLPQTNTGEGLSINASGNIAGTTWINSSSLKIQNAFFYNGTLHNIGTLSGASDAIAVGINSSNNIIGWSGTGTPGDGENGFIAKATASLELDLLGSNIEGILVAEPSDAFSTGHAFFYNGTTQTMTDLGTLGGSFSTALGMNNSNDVVGVSETASGAYHAFLDVDGTMTDLNSLLAPGSGWTLIDANSINANGDIAGFGQFNGNYEGFLLTPGNSITGPTGPGGPTAVPLPSAFWTTLAMLAAMGFFAKFKSSRLKVNA